MNHKQNQLGRSMIEMLGVLAIVGILSVGGIKGLQKAIHSYRYNKTFDQWAQIIPAVDNYVKQLKKRNRFKAPQHDVYLKSMLKRTKVIPPEMIKENSGYIYDALNNVIGIYHHTSNYIGFSVWGEGYKKDFYDICRLSLTFGRQYYKTADVYFYKNFSQGVGSFKSDHHCTSSNCLKDLDETKIIKFCTEWQDVEQPRAIIVWRS